MRVIVHGGAGGTPDEPESRQAVLDDAAAAGAAATTPVDAIEGAIQVLESDDRFNAGYGGAVQSDGVVRTDAGVMLSDRSAGAACSMPGVEHAVSVARAVMEETPHVFVSGDHAVDLAGDFGIETDVDLLTEEKRERFEEETPPQGSPGEHLQWLETRFGSGSDQAGGTNESTVEAPDTDRRGARDTASDIDRRGARDTASDIDRRGARDTASDIDRRGARDTAPDHDTVGAVACDGDTFAAATSTGGRSFALAGRVGDVPQIGSGFYCSPAGGASATGAGEDIARVTLSRRAVRHLEDGLDAQAAADRALSEFDELTGSGAGIVVLDESDAGSAFNTDGMQTSVATDW